MERNRLQLEIKELQRWYRRPAYVQALGSVLVAIIAASGTLIWAVSNGYFDLKDRELQLRRVTLEIDNRKLSDQQTRLTNELKAIEEERYRAATSLRELQRSIADLTVKASKYQAEAETCRGEVQRWSKSFEAIQQKLTDVSLLTSTLSTPTLSTLTLPGSIITVKGRAGVATKIMLPGGLVIKESVIGLDGIASFSVSPGRYELLFSEAGFDPVKILVEMRENETKVIPVALKTRASSQKPNVDTISLQPQ